MVVTQMSLAEVEIGQLNQFSSNFNKITSPKYRETIRKIFADSVLNRCLWKTGIFKNISKTMYS